jgi:chemotaxis protein MotB
MAKKKCECPAGLPGWLATFADLMSLLLCFFILIVSFSSTEIIKFKKAMGSFKAHLGVLPNETKVVKNKEIYIPKLSDSQNKKVRAAVKRMQNMLRGYQGKKPKDKSDDREEKQKMEEEKDVIKRLKEFEEIKLQITEKGISLRISNDMLFKSGRAVLNSEIHPLLDLVVDITKGWPNTIHVEGHTDDVPINTTQFPSNWELSASRAISVIRYFIDNKGTPADHVSATGYGEHRPLVPNNTQQNRAKNRRVEIYINYDAKQSDNINEEKLNKLRAL